MSTITTILREAKERPLLDPLPMPVAVAIAADVVRTAGLGAVADAQWTKWAKDEPAVWAEQMVVLAWLLGDTSMGAVTAAGLQGRSLKPVARFDRFFESVRPLTGELLRNNSVRLEEFIRKWFAAWELAIDGETAEKAKARLDQIDYQRALKEYERAEVARKAEAEKRAQALREAQAREAASNSWHE